MTAKIFQIADYKYITLLAVCNNCETSWAAELTKSTYEKYVANGQKCICPFCKHTDITLLK